ITTNYFLRNLNSKMHMKERIPESGIIEDRELAEYYNLMAKRYMRFPCQRVLKRVAAKGIEKGKAIDVGTGPGIIPIFISKAIPGIQFKGIDLSPVMIDLAKRNAMEAGINDRVEFEVGSAYSLPVEDHSLDLVLCINTIHHLDHPVDFFNEVARSLKEGGAFVIVDFHRDASFVFIGIFNLLWKAFFGKHPKAKKGFLESVQSSYTIEECRKFLEQSRLRHWKLYTRTLEMWIESMAHLERRELWEKE
ncbi:MAG: methyltransferase domain-containing protein, partial [Desulfobacterales bacterium]|nr:methyltransferase domain-containing protein [Desulfobacterales bacterium]